MTIRFSRLLLTAVATVSAGVGGEAMANTLNQNTAWTITRSGATSTYRVVAYGDSIYAGYNGSTTSVAKRAAPLVDGEYLGKVWNSNVSVIRRTKSGATSDDIYNNKIISERSYMQDASTRVVTFEMCGNDYLQARSSFAGQTGTCSYTPIDNALANCTAYTEKAMQAINTYGTTAKVKIVSNLYYPGYNADNVSTSCTDATTGTSVNKRDKFLPYLARSNYRTCSLAAKYGFQCVDAFAEFMGADYDTNGDGVADNVALRFNPSETEDAYVTRITQTLKATLHDANTKPISSSATADYLQSDDTHPTYYLSTTLTAGLFGGSTGSGAADFADTSVVGGKNTQWNKQGHERMGWAGSTFGPAAP